MLGVPIHLYPQALMPLQERSCTSEHPTDVGRKLIQLEARKLKVDDLWWGVAVLSYTV